MMQRSARSLCFRMRSRSLRIGSLVFPQSFVSSLVNPPSTRSTDEDECCTCTAHVGEHVLGEVLKAVDKVCTDPKCPVLKKRCDWIAANKEEFTGYLVAKIKPMHDGYIYCMGNGTCAHPNSTFTQSPAGLSAAFDRSGSEHLLEQVAAASAFVDQGLAHTFAAPTAAEELTLSSSMDGLLAPSLPSASMLAAPTDEDGGAKSRCHRCLSHGVRWVMKRSIRHLKHVCKSTTCPFMQKFCAWAKDHRAFVRGIIYAKVAPYKYAIGWCFGKDQCSHRTARADLRDLPFSMKGERGVESRPIVQLKTVREKDDLKARRERRKNKLKYYEGH